MAVGANNNQGSFIINKPDNIPYYDYFNLTAAERTNSLHSHFEYLEGRFKDQLK